MKTNTQNIINPIMNELLYKGNLVRIGGTYEQPLYVAQDICSILELKHLKLLERLPNWAKGSPLKGESHKGKGGHLKGATTSNDVVDSIHHVSRARKTQEYATLTEAGLYYLLARSNKPEALGFQEWLFTQVLPQLRKQGFYVAQGMNPELAQVAQGRALKARAAELKREAAELEEQAASLLTIRDGMTVREALEEDDMLFDEMYLLRAANMMARIAKKEGIPSGLRGRTRTYPRKTLFSVLGINQTEMSFSSEGRN